MISGVVSIHNNKKEDRVFRLRICKLSPICTVLKSIEYDYDSPDLVWDIEWETAGTTTKDNLNHPAPGLITVTMEKNKQQSLANSYTFSKTSGYEIQAR